LGSGSGSVHWKNPGSGSWVRFRFGSQLCFLKWKTWSFFICVYISHFIYFLMFFFCWKRRKIRKTWSSIQAHSFSLCAHRIQIFVLLFQALDLFVQFTKQTRNFASRIFFERFENAVPDWLFCIEPGASICLKIVNENIACHVFARY
jgi:hypothetical protein